MHTARTPEAQGLANSLNAAAKDTAYSLIAARNNIQRKAMANFNAYTHYLNPNARCNAHGFFTCLQNSGDRWDPASKHPSDCARINDCATRWQDATKDVRKQV